MVFAPIFLSKFFLFAQDPVCGIAFGPSGLQSFQEYDPELASSNFCIKVYFILYGDRDENNNCVDLVPLDRQNSVINDLNSAFPSSIQFYYDETETEIYCEKDLISLTNACGYLNNDFGIQKPTDGIIIHLASDNVGSLIYNGLNESSDFLENDFTFSEPVLIRPDWRTNNQVLTATKTNIGTLEEGSANCFDYKSNALGVTADYELIYYYLDDSQTSQNCQVINNETNYSVQEANSFRDICTNNGIYQRINPDGDADPGILFETNWSTHITHTQVLNEISHYEQALAGADSSWQSANAQVQSIQDTLDEWINYALFRSEMVGDSSLAIQALMPLLAFKYQKKLVGVYLEEGMYNEAESLLSSMNTENIQEALFKEVQEINLRHINGESPDSIDFTDIERLKEITYQPYPAAGFAYGLYYKFTGKLLELPLDTPGQMIQPKPAATSAEPMNFTEKSFAFPNPASTDIVIKSNQAFSALGIYSINGKKVVEKEFGETSTYKFQSSELPPGLYIIQLSNKRRFVDRIKFVKQ
jgi:hypothetical protein